MSDRPPKPNHDLPDHIYCLIPEQPCNCPPGTCADAGIVLTTCQKCGATAAAFICATPDCPVNGGAAYG